MKLINLGCGKTFHSDWVNVDLTSDSEDVIAYDIRRKLPYPDNYFDACYSSHVLEHLTKEEANYFLKECCRILKPNGIVRIVVPDLETITRNYLAFLDELKQGNKEVEANYDWMMLELYDQTVRSLSGGDMKQFLLNPNLPNKAFVQSRLGEEVTTYWKPTKDRATLWQKIQGRSLGWWLRKIRLELAKILILFLFGQDMRLVFQEAIMRSSGEIHRWMYDPFSLTRVLEKNGFREIKTCHADESLIPYFNDYQLDAIDRRIRKPDSLFMEGIKP
ncbi:MAG: methyltransferase domain-containing protein [Microcystaceae cyanobacterium]